MLTIFAILAVRRYVVAHPFGALRLVALLLLCLLGQPIRSFAQGNLLISPRRVVFEGSKRTSELNLANTGTDTARFLISVIEVRMREDGGFEVLDPDSAGASIASPYVRFFPRTVTLAPNEAQTVKVQVVRAAELTAGEYRSHLYFRAAPEEKPLGDAAPKNDSSVTVSLRPVFGISIPVIIRVGADSTRTSISDAAFTPGEAPGVRLVLNRSGNMSVYGDLHVEHIGTDGSVTPVGLARGIAVYTTVPRREFALPLDKEAKVDYARGSLRLSYLDQSPAAAKIAEAVVTLSP